MMEIKTGWNQKINYSVYISSNNWAEKLIELAGKGRFSGFLLISDENVFSLYGRQTIDLLKEQGREVFQYVISPGERSKNINTWVKMVDEVSTWPVYRDTLVILLGGGVVGDLGGFFAGTFFRGLPFVNIPTTLLAQVDSSLGGKTGINLFAGKNLLGSFYHPHSVIINPGFLFTLSYPEFCTGMAEVIKTGYIKNYEIIKGLGELEELAASWQKEWFLAGKLPPEYFNSFIPSLERIIYLTCSGKLEIVREDVSDLGIRRLLNFGHTVGHALEKLSGYSLKHGEAVALGMICETYLGYRLGISPLSLYSEIKELLKRWYPGRHWEHFKKKMGKENLKEELLLAVKKDKKMKARKLVFSCPEAPGQGRIYEGLSFEQFSRLLGDFLNREVK